MVDPHISSIYSILLKANGHMSYVIWHKSSMEKGVVPRHGIDTDACRWGYSHTKGWIFGYKLHLTDTTGDLVVPLTADVTTTNILDNQIYVSLVSSSCVFSLTIVRYMTSDPAGMMG